MLYLAYRPVSLCEVWLQEGVKQVACQALNCIIYWQDMDALAILNICTLQTQLSLVYDCHFLQIGDGHEKSQA